MITINSFEYYGPYIIEPSRRFFESMLRCNTSQRELVSKNLIVTENKMFDPHLFPIMKAERQQLVDKYMGSVESASEQFYCMVDAFVTPGHEKEVIKMFETDCYQRVLCLMLLTEETRFALKQLGSLQMFYCVAHLNELDAENNQLPVHMHMAFCAKEKPSEEMLKALKEIAVGDFNTANPQG